MEELVSRTISMVTTLLPILLISTTTIISQSITVTVKDEKSLEISHIAAYVNLTETTFDFVQPEYPELNIPKSLSAETFLAELRGKQLSFNMVESNTESKNYYERHTKKQQVKTIKTTNYYIKINNSKDLTEFKNIMNAYPNIKIISTKFESKNEDATLKELTEELISEANIKANKMAKLVGKKISNVSNIKVLNMQTEGDPIGLTIFILEQKGHMELEVTFDTENL